MLGKILQEARENEKFRARLKAESPVYPDILCIDDDDYSDWKYVSTLVRIEREGVYYLVHCVECGIIRIPLEYSQMFARFIESVYNIQHLYVVQGEVEGCFNNKIKLEDIDRSQTSELERLLQRERNKQNTTAKKRHKSL